MRLAAVMVTLAWTVLVVAQTSQPKTVLDFYNLLPEKYFEADRAQRVSFMLDPKRGAVVDLRNGYLYAPGDGAQSDIYLSLFKKRTGGYLVGVKFHASDTQDETYLDFYDYQNSSWVLVTKSVIPVNISAELKYVMPRYGTTIYVRNKRGPLYDLVWAGEKFRLRR